MTTNKEIAKKVLNDIDGYCIEAYDDGHRNHLGASMIGDECKRKLYLVFRWAKKEKFDGRKLRLFNRGHREEDRFIEWLRGIGATVYEYDFQNNALVYEQATGKYEVLNRQDFENINSVRMIRREDLSQDLEHVARAKASGVKLPQFRMPGVMGHYGGSLDCIVELPEEYNMPEPILGEFKTNKTGAGFNKLQTNGVILEKPMHFTQKSCYGRAYDLKKGLYLNINKNDDDLHIELVDLDHNLGMQMELKAEQIITATEAPPMLSSDSTFWKCRFCHFHPICHKGEAIETNCRSCKHAKAVPDADWYCGQHNAIIPKEYIPQACPSHIPVV